MSQLSEKREWTEGIYELRETDAVLGGADGISNRQATQLASRTQWLKNELAARRAEAEAHLEADNPHPQYQTATDAVADEVSRLTSSMKTHAATLAELTSGLDSWSGSVENRLATIPAPAGTQICFVQSTAPLGWTKVARHNDKVLRIVSGEATHGGTVPFTEAFAARSISGSIGATTLNEAQMPAHEHTFNIFSYNAKSSLYGLRCHSHSENQDNGISWAQSKTVSYANTNVTGSGSSHTHSLKIDAPDFNVQYVDAIIASKDADQ